MAFTLFGLTISGNPNSRGFCDLVVEKVAKMVRWMEKGFLSLVGMITLIQVCLSHIPSYFLSLCRILVSVAIRLEKLQRDFLWSGSEEGKKDHLLN